jgi:CBS domain-containing protein
MPVVKSRSILSGMLVKEVMRSQVVQLPKTASLSKGINHLIKHKINALLVTDEDRHPAGVVSKTDLVAAYHHGMSLAAETKTIMHSPLLSCDQRALLDEAIRLMLLKDVHRVFVNSGDPLQITGVLSLSDAARIRSGSCHACISSRIIPKG